MPVQQFDLSSNRIRFSHWPWIFALIALEGVGAAVYLAQLPADPGGGFLGLSANRLALLALLVAGALAFAFLALGWRRARVLAERIRPAWRRGLLAVLFLLLPIAALSCLLAPLTLMSLYRTGGAYHYLAYYQRLLPLFAWELAACLEVFIGLAASGAWDGQALKNQRPVWRAALIAWCVFGLLGIFVALTGIGITPDRVGWGLPTVSLMEWQIWLAWAAGSGLLVWMAFRGWGARGDVLLAVAIWLLAVGLWLSQPIRPAFFATAGRAPNFEIYPFSDGAYYAHFAQSTLIGNGFKSGEIPARPMYVTLLALFHLIAGQNYENIITVQTLLLAFFPVVLFFLGRALHSRAAGVVIALLAILREVTAIYAMPVTNNASNSKLFFADLPTALVISLWMLAVVVWLKAAHQQAAGPVVHRAGWRALLPLLVGGSLGAAMLFRTQSMFMLPAALLLGLLAYRWNWARWLRAVGLVGLGLALTLSPWLLRNASATGRLAFDDDKSQTGSMAQRYTFSGTDARYVYRQGEDAQEYSRRVTQGIFDFLKAHPDFVAGFVGAHWLNAETDNLLVLPVRSGIIDLRELLMPQRPTWEDWNGELSPWQALLFAINAGIIALGIGACWVRAGWSGLAPLLANLSYNFSNALARNSGDRYLLPVDWVMYAYAAVGLLEITIAVLGVLGVSPGRLSPFLVRRETLPEGAVRGQRRPALPYGLPGALIGLGLVFYGSLPWLVEQMIPARYPQQTQAELLGEVLENDIVRQAGLDRAALEHFMTQPGAIVVKGRALYPRYYARGDGELRTAKTGYEPLDYARTVFLVTANTYNGLAILKAQTVPDPFPHPSDVIIVGCPGATYLDARLVLVLGEPGGAYTAGEGFSERCPGLENTPAEVMPSP